MNPCILVKGRQILASLCSMVAFAVIGLLALGFQSVRGSGTGRVLANTELAAIFGDSHRTKCRTQFSCTMGEEVVPDNGPPPFCRRCNDPDSLRYYCCRNICDIESCWGSNTTPCSNKQYEINTVPYTPNPACNMTCTTTAWQVIQLTCPMKDKLGGTVCPPGC